MKNHFSLPDVETTVTVQKFSFYLDSRIRSHWDNETSGKKKRYEKAAHSSPRLRIIGSRAIVAIEHLLALRHCLLAGFIQRATPRNNTAR